jgi:hypothetical protein
MSRWLAFRLRTLFVVATYIALTCGALSLEQGSWPQRAAAILLFVVIFGGIALTVFSGIRQSQSRDRRYESNAGDRGTPFE